MLKATIPLPSTPPPLALMGLPAPGYFFLRPQLLTRFY
jgi:hypothetical protein